ncbi:MAG: DMT family transporter [Rhodobacteraceae bacterium]|nr:DMT family transporter [Paracoccaceae bacterium]
MKSGVFLILLSVSLTPFGDALSKQLGQTQSPFFIVFLRYFTAGLIALALARMGGITVRFPARDRAGTILRTALVIGAMTLLIMALSMIPLANAVGGFLIAPIVATLISVAIYGEKLTFPRLAGSLISFLGALLILRPGTSLEPGMLLALAGGGLLGAFLAASRGARCGQHPVSALAVQCLLGSAMLAPLALPAISGMSIALLTPALLLGVVTAATHFLTVAAYQRSEAARLAPFFYFNLVAALIVGLVWFHEIPGWPAMIGLGCIVAGGLISLVRAAPIGSNLGAFRREIRGARLARGEASELL